MDGKAFDMKDFGKDKEGKSNEGESEDLATSESSQEASVAIPAALESGSRVGVHSNGHSDVTSED